MDKHLEIPILVGRSESISEEIALIGKDVVPLWDYQWEVLSDDELILYFKGVVMLEEYYWPGGHGLGSATGTKLIYRTILERHLDDNHAIGDWAIQHNGNSYVPLDWCKRGKTIDETLAMQQAINDRIITEKIESIERKQEKKRLKAEAHAERLKKKEERDRTLGYKKE